MPTMPATAQPHEILLNQAAAPRAMTAITAMGVRIARRLVLAAVAPRGEGTRAGKGQFRRDGSEQTGDDHRKEAATEALPRVLLLAGHARIYTYPLIHLLGLR